MRTLTKKVFTVYSLQRTRAVRSHFKTLLVATAVERLVLGAGEACRLRSNYHYHII